MAGPTASNVVDSPLIQEVIDKRPVTGLQVMILAIALILNMLDGFDVVAMAFTVHSIGEEMGLAPDRLGYAFSVAAAGMMIGAMFLAPISDRIGRRKMVLGCVLTIGLSVIATGLASNLWQLISFRAITGLAIGGMLASLATMASEYTPEKYRTLAVVTVTAGYPLGATLGGFVAAPLLAKYGWNSVFFAGGGATLAMVILVFLFMPESLQFLINKQPKNALSKLNNVLKRLHAEPVAEMPPAPDADKIETASVMSLLARDRRSQTLRLWTAFFFCFISLYFLMSWVPKLVIESGLSESTGVYAGAAFNGGGVLGIVVLGWIAARVALSKLIGSFLVLAALNLVIYAMFIAPNALMLNLLLIGFFLQGGFTGLYAVAAKIYPTEMRATGVGWAIGLGRFGAVVGPFLGGIFIAQGVSMEINFLIFALPLVFSGLFAYTLAVR